MDVIRIQDRFGRGPYRPGMSQHWSDPFGFVCPPWWEEIGEDFAAAHERFTGSYHFGCGFYSMAQLDRWFNRRELRALDRLGYRLARIVPAIILVETSRQVVFGAARPLAQYPAAKIGSAAAERLAA